MKRCVEGHIVRRGCRHHDHRVRQTPGHEHLSVGHQYGIVLVTAHLHVAHRSESPCDWIVFFRRREQPHVGASSLMTTHDQHTTVAESYGHMTLARGGHVPTAVNRPVAGS